MNIDVGTVGRSLRRFKNSRREKAHLNVLIVEEKNQRGFFPVLPLRREQNLQLLAVLQGVRRGDFLEANKTTGGSPVFIYKKSPVLTVQGFQQKRKRISICFSLPGIPASVFL